MSVDLRTRWSELAKILECLNISVSSYNDLRTMGYLIAKGDTWNYRTVLQKLGFIWRRSDRLTILQRQTFEDRDYSKISIKSLINEEEAKERIGILIAMIHHAQMQELVRLLIENLDHHFYTNPAASANHHAYLYGLAEHTIQVTEVAIQIAEYYQFANINMDLVITGALLHDIGKVDCYHFDDSYIEVTSSLNRMGHVAKGAQLIAQENQKIKNPIDEKLMDQILHIVLSHQLMKEWESPIEPQIPEAWIVYCADQASSKIGGMIKYR